MYVATTPPTLQKASPTIRLSGGPSAKEVCLILSAIQVAHGMPNETNKNAIIEALCRRGFVPVPSSIAPLVSVYAVTVSPEEITSVLGRTVAISLLANYFNAIAFFGRPLLN